MIQQPIPNFIRRSARAARKAAIGLIVGAGLLVDVFAGIGGGSIASERAHGRPVDIAINHWASAIQFHEKNHPLPTRHFVADVWDVDPDEATEDMPVLHAHFSPDCRHFANAKGSAPVADGVRCLPWIVLRWAKAKQPTLITLENVREFLTWAPTLPQMKNGKAQFWEDGTPKRIPDATKKGLTFRIWLGRLKALGYNVAWRILDAADYGAPTHRKRLFVVARCDGKQIEWPAPTHGDEKTRAFNPLLLPYRTAAECIDFDRPCPSIFLDREGARAYKKLTGIQCRRPLEDKTLWRTANGIARFVIGSDKPFIVRVGHYSHVTGEGGGFRGQAVDEPLATVTGTNDKALVSPTLAKFYGSGDGQHGQHTQEPLDTITTVDRFGLIACNLVRTNHGGQEVRASSVEEPLGAVTTKRGTGVSSAVLVEVQNSSNEPGSRDVQRPMPTIMGNPKGGGWALGALHLMHFHSEKGTETRGSELTDPLPTQDTSNRFAVVSAFITKFYGTAIGQSVNEPLSTITAGAGGGHMGAVHAYLSSGVDEASLAGFWRVYAFLVQHLGPDAPLPFVRADGHLYLIVDIGLRMLTPRELLRAQFTPELAADYVLPDNKELAVRMIGNSVSPPVLEAVIRAQRITRIPPLRRKAA